MKKKLGDLFLKVVFTFHKICEDFLLKIIIIFNIKSPLSHLWAVRSVPVGGPEPVRIRPAGGGVARGGLARRRHLVVVGQRAAAVAAALGGQEEEERGVLLRVGAGDEAGGVAGGAAVVEDAVGGGGVASLQWALHIQLQLRLNFSIAMQFVIKLF